MFRHYAKKLLTRRAAAYKPLNSIELSAANMLHNLKLIQSQHPGQAVFPVLKGNAYGHGLTQIADILNAADVPMLAVDGYFEAAAILPLTRHRLLVMGYILPENVRLLDVRRCSFVLQDEAGLHAFGRLKKPVRIHLEVNTGMNRLGLQPEELDGYLAVLRQYPTLHLEGVMTHLADADNEVDDSFTQTQAARFDALVEHVRSAGFTPEYLHIAQTAGSVKAKSRSANALRLGIGLYGIQPFSASGPLHSKLAQLRPVLELKSTIIKVIDLQKGDPVSYNGTFRAPHSMRIAVLPLGYYEGVPRVLSNAGCAVAAGRELPIVGRICMNHTMIDISGSKLAVGDTVTLISRDPTAANSVAELKARHALFAYTTLTGLSAIRRTIIR
jgi:alanine racemase